MQEHTVTTICIFNHPITKQWDVGMLQNAQTYNKTVHTCPFPGWIILWLQASVAWYYIHEWGGGLLLGGVRQGKTRWSGTTWATFAEILPEPWRGALTQPRNMATDFRNVPKSTEEKKTNSQFSPIRIYTFTDLIDRLWKAASLHRNKLTEK